MIRHHARVIWTLISLFTLYSVHGAWAGSPTDQLREGVELRGPPLRRAITIRPTLISFLIPATPA